MAAVQALSMGMAQQLAEAELSTQGQVIWDDAFTESYTLTHVKTCGPNTQWFESPNKHRDQQTMSHLPNPVCNLFL